MHELAITRHLLDKTLKYAKKNQAKKVTDIHVKLGEFSGYVTESIDFYWQEIAKDTIAEKASITFEVIQGQLQCYSCKQLFPKGKELEQCPLCKSLKIIVAGGNDLSIDYIKIEDVNYCYNSV